MNPPSYDRPLQLRPCCLHLRHKMMYCDERQNIPGLVDSESDTRVYFCIKSQESLGPDGGDVHPKACTRARSCYCSGVGVPASEADRVAPAADDASA